MLKFTADYLTLTLIGKIIAPRAFTKRSLQKNGKKLVFFHKNTDVENNLGYFDFTKKPSSRAK
jgi:hypothetical protein